MKPINVFSSGGGVQSTAVLVLSAQGQIDYPIHVFANVGDRSESKKTIDYVANVLVPYAKENGIQWIEVAKRDKKGAAIDLLDKLESSQKSVPIPVRMAGSGAPGNRSCTVDWKIKPVAKHLRSLIPKEVFKKVRSRTNSELPNCKDEIDQQYEALKNMRTKKKKTEKQLMDAAIKAVKFRLDTEGFAYFFPISLGKGISTDEAQRAKSFTGFPYYSASYPLIDLRLSRSDCERIIQDAGLPPSPKSSCWFCPYQTKSKWQDLRDNDPALFQSAVDLEKRLHGRSVELGRGGCFFTSNGTTKQVFLDVVTSPHQQYDLFHGFDDEGCESGHCWT